ncbi:MAG: OmpH family outer membrane protein [Bacteroidota bacterium]
MKKLVFAILLITGLSINAQSQKIGYIDSQVLYQNYAPAIKAQQDLQILQQNWTRERDSLAVMFQEKVNSYQNQKALMTPQKQQETEQQLLVEQNSIMQREQQIVQKGQTMMKPIKDAVNKAISDVAKKQKLNFVFDKGVEGVVSILHYADAEYDITYKVLDKLKKN